MEAKEIKEVFDRYTVPMTKDDLWQVQGTWVVKHKALERLSGKLGIQFDDPKMMVQTDDELVMFVRGHIDRDGKQFSDWSLGEVLTGGENANYKTKGKQPSYRWAILEKRCRDRVILKLAGLHGAYSEDEAEDFKRENRTDTGEETSSRAQRPALPEIPRSDNVVPMTKGSDQPRNEADVKALERQAKNLGLTVVDGVPVDADGVVQDQTQDAKIPDPKTPEGILAGLLGRIDALQAANDGDGIYRFMTEGGANDRAKALGNGPYMQVRDRANAALKALGWKPASKGDAKAKPA